MLASSIKACDHAEILLLECWTGRSEDVLDGLVAELVCKVLDLSSNVSGLDVLCSSIARSSGQGTKGCGLVDLLPQLIDCCTKMSKVMS